MQHLNIQAQFEFWKSLKSILGVAYIVYAAAWIIMLKLAELNIEIWLLITPWRVIEDRKRM